MYIYLFTTHPFSSGKINEMWETGQAITKKH